MDGILQGIRLVHNYGGTTCWYKNPTFPEANWDGCGIRVVFGKLLSENAETTSDIKLLYPTIDIDDITSFDPFSHVPDCNCNVQQISMESYSSVSLRLPNIRIVDSNLASRIIFFFQKSSEFSTDC